MAEIVKFFLPLRLEYPFPYLETKQPVLEKLLMHFPTAAEKSVSNSALVGVAQWIECWPVNQRVASSIPSQGPCLGFGPCPQLGVCKRQPHIDVSLPLLLPSSLSKNK